MKFGAQTRRVIVKGLRFRLLAFLGGDFRSKCPAQRASNTCPRQEMLSHAGFLMATDSAFVGKRVLKLNKFKRDGVYYDAIE